MATKKMFSAKKPPAKKAAKVVEPKKAAALQGSPKKVSKFGKAGSPIKDKAYQNRRDVVDVEINDGVTAIGARAFGGCVNLESIVIPKSVKEIAPDAFDGCIRLSKVEYAGPACRFEGGAVLSKDGRRLIRWLPAFSGAVKVPDTVVELGEKAFAEIGSVTAVELPEGLQAIGERSFQGCAGFFRQIQRHILL